jgi:DNA-binding NarL/FixJ family response regulator
MTESLSLPALIRVLIVDDQALIRRGMTLMLSAEPDMEVVGQAADGFEAVEMAQRLRPDVILMDLHMPRKGGVVATREIVQKLPDTQVLVLTTLDADDMVFEAVRAGAQAYLLKDASEAEVLETIRALRRGESWLTPQIARKVMDQFRQMASVTLTPAVSDSATEPENKLVASEPEKMQTSGCLAETLSLKEGKILSLIVEGKSNKQIADIIFLAEGTVKNYVSRIMDKLQANTRTKLAVMSVRHQHGDPA